MRKENAYVFDFDPARTLTIFEEFANDLYTDTASGGGTLDDRKRRIRTLLNFFPVIGEDENGEMVELDAERVLSIPAQDPLARGGAPRVHERLPVPEHQQRVPRAPSR